MIGSSAGTGNPILAALAGCVLLTQAGFASAEVKLDAVDRPLPDFNLLSMENETWNADSLAGKPWLINFWATWCPPCIEEIPSMNEAWKVLKDQGVGMLAINAGEGREAVEDFLEQVDIDFPGLMGDTNSLPNWSVRVLPTTLIVDANGQVVFEALGPREWNDAALLQKMTELVPASN